MCQVYMYHLQQFVNLSGSNFFNVFLAIPLSMGMLFRWES